jgi:drug/metabolite transporter (DMT)-like permease
MTSGSRRYPLGLRYMVASAFFFSLMSLLVKTAGRTLPTQEVVLFRSIGVSLLSWSWLARRGVPIWGNRRGLLLVRSLFGFGALSCFYYAVIHLPLADATVLQFTNPVFTAILAAVILGEAIGLGALGLSLLSLVGVVLVARPTFLFQGLGSALDPYAVGVALTGAVCSAAAYVTIRVLRATEDPMVIVFNFALFSTLAAVPTVLSRFRVPTPAELGLLAATGVATYLGQVYLTRGLVLEQAGRATSIGYLQIVFAAFWGLVVFGEVPAPLSITGAVLIVLSTLRLAGEPVAR